MLISLCWMVGTALAQSESIIQRPIQWMKPIKRSKVSAIFSLSIFEKILLGQIGVSLNKWHILYDIHHKLRFHLRCEFRFHFLSHLVYSLHSLIHILRIFRHILRKLSHYFRSHLLLLFLFQPVVVLQEI